MTTESKPMSEYKKFYINADKFNCTLGLDYIAKENEMRKFLGIEVIEIAALTDLQKQVDELKQYVQRCDDNNCFKLQQQIADYEKALELVMKNLRYYPDNQNPQGDAEIDAAYNNAEAVLAKYRSETNG